jgi:hypothetical protein
MKTTVIQIGNSDNKLTQEEWSDFIDEVNYIIYDMQLYFVGGSNNSSPYQNYCWVIGGELPITRMEELRDCALEFKQDSIAVTIGETTLLETNNI